MLKASALFIVLFVSLVIGILCSALIYSAFLYNIQVYDSIKHGKMNRNANSAINFLFSQKGQVFNSIIDLYGDEEDSVYITNKNWGVFDVAVVKAFSGKYQSSKVLMYGYKGDSLSELSIYLVDQQRPLSVSGNTLIKGVAYLPEAGVKSAYVEGQSFSGKTFVEGNIKKSSYSLPALDTILLRDLVKEISNPYIELSRNVDDQDTLWRSFNDSTIYISSSSSMYLNKKVLSGNIIVHSNQIVFISKDCSLSDILVTASAVVVESGFVGNLQIFVKDSLIIGSNCEFIYPSVAGLIKTDFKSKQSFIKIGANTLFQGLIFSHQVIRDLKETLITTDIGSYIEGQVYSDGLLDLKKDVFGSVYCNKFLLMTTSGIYENTLLNVRIDNSKLSRHYIGSSLLSSKNKKSIIKWLE